MSDENSLRFDIGTVTYSEHDPDRFLGVQVDLNGDASAPTFEVHHPFGFFSVPLDPDADGKGCTALYAWEGNQGHAWLGSDPRTAAKIPTAAKGSAGIYGATGTVAFIDGEKGTFQVYAPYANGAKVATIAVDFTTAGAESITIAHGEGMAVTMLAGGKNSVVVRNKAGDAYVEVNDDGIVINGAQVKVNGGILMGDPASAQPLALAAPIVAWAAQVVAACAAAPGGPIPIPPLSPTAAATKASAT